MIDDFTSEIVLEWINQQKGLLEAQRGARKLQKDVKSLKAQFKDYSQQALRHMDNFAAGLVRTGKKFMVFGALGIAAFAGLAYKASQAGAKLEGYRVTLNQLYGDAKEAGDAMEWIMGMQVKTPYTPDELLGALKPLKVFGMDAKKWLPAIGDMASTMGKDLKDAATGVAKAFSAGQAGADALRESYGVTMANLVKVSGYTEKELRNDMEAYRDALFTFIADPKFKGGMTRFAATFKGVLSSIKGGLQTFVMYTGEAINEVMKEDFKKVVDWIVKMYESGKLKEWAKRVAEGFKMVYQGLKKAGQVIWKFISPIVKFFREHPNMLKWAIAAVAGGSALSLLGGGVMMLGGKLWQLGRGITGIIGKFRAFGGAARGLFSTLQQGGGIAGMLSGRGGMLGGLGKLAGGLGGKLAGKAGILGKLGGLLTGGGGAGGLAGSLGAIAPIIMGIVAAIVLFGIAFKKNFSGLRDATKKALKPLKEMGLGITSVKDLFGQAFKFIKRWWTVLAKILAPVFRLIMSVVGIITRLLKALFAPFKKLFSTFKTGEEESQGLLDVFIMYGEVIALLLKPIEWLADGIDWLVEVIEKGVMFLGRLFGLIGRKLGEKIGKEFRAFKKLAGGVCRVVGRWFSDLWKGITAGVRKAVDWIKNVWDKARAWIKTKFIDPVRNFFTSMWERIKEPALRLVGWMKTRIIDPIKNFFKSIFAPFENAFKKFFRWIGDLIRRAPGWIKKFLGITDEEMRALADFGSVVSEPVDAGLLSRMGTGAMEGMGEEGGIIPEGAYGEAGGGVGGGGAGGPTIQNNYIHHHWTQGAIQMLLSGASPEELKRVLLEIFGQEALANA